MTREHTEVDKGVKKRLTRKTQRQTKEHTEAYKRRHRGSKGMTQRQIWGKSVADKGDITTIEGLHNQEIKRAFNTRSPEIGEVSSRGFNRLDYVLVASRERA